jgi:hypothetical protein
MDHVGHSQQSGRGAGELSIRWCADLGAPVLMAASAVVGRSPDELGPALRSAADTLAVFCTRSGGTASEPLLFVQLLRCLLYSGWAEQQSIAALLASGRADAVYGVAQHWARLAEARPSTDTPVTTVEAVVKWLGELALLERSIVVLYGLGRQHFTQTQLGEVVGVRQTNVSRVFNSAFESLEQRQRKTRLPLAPGARVETLLRDAAPLLLANEAARWSQLPVVTAQQRRAQLLDPRSIGTSVQSLHATTRTLLAELTRFHELGGLPVRAKREFERLLRKLEDELFEVHSGGHSLEEYARETDEAPERLRDKWRHAVAHALAG